MARIYARLKVEGKGWRYRPVPVGRGRRPNFPQGIKFHVRFTDARGKQSWSEPYDSIDSAQEAADNIKTVILAQSRGLSIEDAADITNANRKTIKTAVEEYLHFNRGLRPRTVQAYTNALKIFADSLPRSVRFIDEAATTPILDGFKVSLEKRGYAPKTISNTLLIVVFLLKHFRKETGIDEPSKLVKMPRLQIKTPKPYPADELRKLFAAMTDEEYVRYLFFVHSGCREQEVQYAEWEDINFDEGTYTVRSKNDVGYVPKSHEERVVPLTTELLDLLKTRRQDPPNKRWIFVNQDGGPEGHFLRKFKVVAKKAGLNCGRCEAERTIGKYHRQRAEKVTCADGECSKHYLHRLRKTAATRWLQQGVNVVDIQHWLGHKSLETTMLYLGVSTIHSNRAKIDAAGKF